MTLYGARPLKRAIQKEIETSLGKALLQGQIKNGQQVLVELEGQKVVFSSQS